jgi:acyl-CoA dehydrogenase
VLLAHEGMQDPRDARRLLISRMVLAHRLAAQDPLGAEEPAWEKQAIDLLLSDAPVPLDQVNDVLS